MSKYCSEEEIGQVMVLPPYWIVFWGLWKPSHSRRVPCVAPHSFWVLMSLFLHFLEEQVPIEVCLLILDIECDVALIRAYHSCLFSDCTPILVLWEIPALLSVRCPLRPSHGREQFVTFAKLPTYPIVAGRNKTIQRQEHWIEPSVGEHLVFQWNKDCFTVPIARAPVIRLGPGLLHGNSLFTAVGSDPCGYPLLWEPEELRDLAPPPQLSGLISLMESKYET